jgi:hypothetical protein
MSANFFIAPIVEGHGEVQALPVLLQRMAAAVPSAPTLRVNAPLRVKAGSFLNDDDYFKKYIELAARKAKQWPNSGVLIMLDCEDECPAELGPILFARATACRSDTKIIVLLASREYETWFLAAAKSLRGVCGLPSDLAAPPNPESTRNAKGWISDRMGTAYDEPTHQRKLTAAFSFEEASSVHSFARGLKKIQDFLG